MQGFDYKCARWLRLRESVLREAGYKCQYMARFGRNVEARHVHHIWPAEDYPQFAWCRWNLIALSGEAHNMMHDRATGELSKIGEQLRRRTAPPPRADLAIAERTGGFRLKHTQENFSRAKFSRNVPDQE